MTTNPCCYAIEIESYFGGSMHTTNNADVFDHSFSYCYSGTQPQ